MSPLNLRPSEMTSELIESGGLWNLILSGLETIHLWVASDAINRAKAIKHTIKVTKVNTLRAFSMMVTEVT